MGGLFAFLLTFFREIVTRFLFLTLLPLLLPKKLHPDVLPANGAVEEEED
jgi:hypothetical protein